MRLLEEVVILLSDKNGSLTDALLKMKVLMHRIGHKELAGWMNDELNGYTPDRPVPDYRIIPIRLHGDISNIAWRYPATQLPTAHLEKDVREPVGGRPWQLLRHQMIGVSSAVSAIGQTLDACPLDFNETRHLGQRAVRRIRRDNKCHLLM
jgi:hypothetical protein